MKKFYLQCLAICALFMFQSCVSDDTGPSEDSRNVIYSSLKLSDPSVLFVGDTYYLYGIHDTGTTDDGISAYQSKDLKTWKRMGLVLKGSNFNQSQFNCPEVYKLGEKYYMYYTANNHIYVASSSSPAGPFVPLSNAPVVKNRSWDPCVANMGTQYVLFYSDGKAIRVAKLNNALTAIDESTIHVCLTPTESWETIGQNGLLGAEFMSRNGKFYLRYQTNADSSPDNAVGIAEADDIFGTWTKGANNPILCKPDNLPGVGNNFTITDQDGNMRIFFSVSHSDTQEFPRIMYMADCSFTNDGSMFKVDTSTLVKLQEEYKVGNIWQ